MTDAELDLLAVNTIRTLSMDAVQAAKSGHPGTPMALAPLVYTIWNRAMSFDPQDPIWPNRDRFVLSNGHASMLLWSILHLTKTQAVDADYERLGHPSVSLDDIRRFRQLDSRAPGHPEYHWVSGVETTTGPLGQGVANSVGMAIARKWLASRYNKPGFPIFDYNICAVCGDGCMMEGVASEAASLAGYRALEDEPGRDSQNRHCRAVAHHQSQTRRTDQEQDPRKDGGSHQDEAVYQQAAVAAHRVGAAQQQGDAAGDEERAPAGDQRLHDEKSHHDGQQREAPSRTPEIAVAPTDAHGASTPMRFPSKTR